MNRCNVKFWCANCNTGRCNAGKLPFYNWFLQKLHMVLFLSGRDGSHMKLKRSHFPLADVDNLKIAIEINIRDNKKRKTKDSEKGNEIPKQIKTRGLYFYQAAIL